MVGGYYSASSESFPSWSRWDVLRSWAVTISSWHRWRLRRLGEKNSKKNSRIKVRNQIKLNFTESMYICIQHTVFSIIFMGTKFCALSKINFAVSKMHMFVKMVLSIQYIIRYWTSKNTDLQIKLTSNIHKNWFLWIIMKP